MERLEARASGRIRFVGLVVAGLLHAAVWVWAISYRPPAHAQVEATPIMVSLITAPEIKVAPPEPEKITPPPKPQPRPVIQKQTPKLLAAKTETPVAEEAPAPPPPPVAMAPAPREEAPAPAPLVPPRFNADYLQNPSPPYPTSSRRMGEEGTVMLRVFVSAAGVPEKVELNKSSGSTRLDQSALETVQKRWKFTPARQGDMPTSAWVLVPISFSLES